MTLIAVVATAGCDIVATPVTGLAEAFQAWIAGFGVWGIVILALVYIAATLALLPCAPLSIAAGLAYGLWVFPLVMLAALAGASLAFLLARHVAHDAVHAWADRHPRWAAGIEAISTDGWSIVLLLRLSPVIPFNVQNYLFGVTDIRLPHYIAATAIGLLPGTAVFVALGAFGSGIEGDTNRMATWLMFGVGLATTGLAALLVTRRVLAKLRATQAHTR
jgi:uncharacterized membrane protein YdjX (TVP38/TMEM64 family)